ncbi:unnamed protein product [Dovyalis caffra]|uniref:Uncharacterized protein n=1 Tax=Dovyalis caffra TaxID=77055 RepID=A0AAV1ST20_9ROSI|nr:unnamed protein product [Dovyalis caffra]
MNTLIEWRIVIYWTRDENLRWFLEDLRIFRTLKRIHNSEIRIRQWDERQEAKPSTKNIQTLRKDRLSFYRVMSKQLSSSKRL